MLPTPALFLVIATLLPLVGFAVLVFWGRRMGNPFAGYVGTALMALSFICAMLAMIAWYQNGAYQGEKWGFGLGPINIPIKWIPVGAGIGQAHPGFLDLGIYLDSLTIAMFAMVTLVSTLIFLFSIGYMHEDVRFARFFTYLCLFDFSMLGLLLAGTLLQLFIFWELVGLCSYLLIGFWYEKTSASTAAIKAFVTNRVGDFGFLIGFGILFYHLGNVTLPSMWIALGDAGLVDGVHKTLILLPGGATFGAGALTAMGIGLFFGAVAKSAQFPLHVWLPDAMEGPTPVSALIHAATMVAAGVYLVARIFPVLTPDAKLFIAIIGCITLTMAALIALAQTDIKRVLAYSTVSQLGYMMLALGVGSYVGGLFHLITHAFFKALQFLGAGSVIYAAHHEQEMPQYGGLMRKIPVTAATFAVAVLAIAGTPLLSGFYSKDLILAHIGAFATLAGQDGRSSFYWLLWLLPACVAYVTAFYMTRCWMLTFWGKPRNQHLYDHAHERPILWGPLVVLAVLSIVAGWPSFMGARELIGASAKEATALCERTVKPFHGFAGAWPEVAPESKAQAAGAEVAAGAGEPVPGEHGLPHPKKAEVAASAHGQDPLRHGHELVEKFVWWAFIVGIGLGFLVYSNGYAIVGPLTRRGPLLWLRIWLYRRMYFDELYMAVLVVPVYKGLAALAGLLDSKVIDGIVNGSACVVRRVSVLAGLSDDYVVDGAVNGVAELTQDLGAAVRAPQTGRIRLYVTVLMGVVALGLAAAIIVVLS
jgi:proton-translocating NADH-quinone oxidoreductase chain L